MSKTKHTPGPWTVGRNPGMDCDPLQLGFYKIFAVDGIGEANAYEDFIAEVNVNFRNHEANARLIAAAPELLEAAQRFVEVMDESFGCPDTASEIDKLNKAAAAARAAIAKAIGEQ